MASLPPLYYWNYKYHESSLFSNVPRMIYQGYIYDSNNNVITPDVWKIKSSLTDNKSMEYLADRWGLNPAFYGTLINDGTTPIINYKDDTTTSFVCDSITGTSKSYRSPTSMIGRTYCGLTIGNLLETNLIGTGGNRLHTTYYTNCLIQTLMNATGTGAIYYVWTYDNYIHVLPDNRIETTCCLLALCKPTLYKYVGN